MARNRYGDPGLLGVLAFFLAAAGVAVVLGGALLLVVVFTRAPQVAAPGPGPTPVGPAADPAPPPFDRPAGGYVEPSPAERAELADFFDRYRRTVKQKDRAGRAALIDGVWPRG